MSPPREPSELPEGFNLLGPALTLFSTLPVSWWLTGGWAIDLAAGYVSRAHHGIDFFVLREDAPALTAASTGVTFEPEDSLNASSPGVRPLAAGDHLFVAVPELPLRTQVAFGERDGDDWILLNDPAIRILGTQAVKTILGIPQLAPPVILLMRAFAFRAQDQLDFETALPLLDERERAWLAGSIELHLSKQRSDGGAASHPWLEALRGA